MVICAPTGVSLFQTACSPAVILVRRRMAMQLVWLASADRHVEPWKPADEQLASACLGEGHPVRHCEALRGTARYRC